MIGVDGCRVGWCVAIYQESGLTIEVFDKIETIGKNFPSPELMLIDIPIGLGDRRVDRDVDLIARKHLKPNYTNTIFTPPVREALSSIDYNEAKIINQNISGKKISIQSWNISTKIRELDEYLSSYPSRISLTKEAHPEICFKYLNEGQLPIHKKRAAESRGVKERLKILGRFEPEAMKLYQSTRSRFASSKLANDDIVDAICLAICARLGMQQGLERIHGSNETDSKGIPMGIHYFKPRPT
jgi:predicted RNase H-like nuclease